jgi:hypothetical protein
MNFRNRAERLISRVDPCGIDDGQSRRLIALNYRDQLIHQRLGESRLIGLSPGHGVFQSVDLAIG